MAFQMIHMEVAYRLLNHIPQIENPAEFILDSVAPDSVHMNPNYNITMKVKSHMFEGCGMWSDTRDYQRWIENIYKFFCRIADGEDGAIYRDFCIGLCVHCITDYCNDLKIWRKLQSKNIPPMKLEDFREAYYPEARGIDVWLYQNSNNTKAIREMLEDAIAIDVEGFIKKVDIETQRSHLLNTQYNVETEDISDYRFLTAGDINSFIESTVRDIDELLTKWMAVCV